MQVVSVTKRDQKDLFKIYKVLYKAFGPQEWWPAESDFEVMVGAILTQNTAWTNVEKAIRNLKEKKVLSLNKIIKLPVHDLAKIIRPTGYFNVKSARLKSLINWLKKRCDGEINQLRSEKLEDLREELLGVSGVGPETADSILLYALGKTTFVVDAYTKRIFSRHGFISEKEDYRQVKRLFEEALPKQEKIYNEFHALIVKVGKEFCRKKPLCRKCPLEKDLQNICC